VRNGLDTQRGSDIDVSNKDVSAAVGSLASIIRMRIEEEKRLLTEDR
jgi:hypothetical protein